MDVVNPNSLWPYATVYNTGWNGMSVAVDGVPVGAKRWFQFVLWNGHGTEDIKVVGVHTGAILYPTDEEVSTLRTGFGMTTTSYDDHGGRYHIINVNPPQDETELRITVTDKLGNVTEGTVVLASVEI